MKWLAMVIMFGSCITSVWFNDAIAKTPALHKNASTEEMQLWRTFQLVLFLMAVVALVNFVVVVVATS